MKAAGIDMASVIVSGVRCDAGRAGLDAGGRAGHHRVPERGGQGGGALDAAVKLSKGEAVDQKVYIPFRSGDPGEHRQLPVEELIRPDRQGAAFAPPLFSCPAPHRGERVKQRTILGGGHRPCRRRHMALAPEIRSVEEGATAGTERLHRFGRECSELRDPEPDQRVELSVQTCANNVDAIFTSSALDIMILQVAITGIIAIGVTQVIILGGIDLSSGRSWGRPP